MAYYIMSNLPFYPLTWLKAQIGFEIDATALSTSLDKSFSTTSSMSSFERIIFNFPHYPGKTNTARNRQLIQVSKPLCWSKLIHSFLTCLPCQVEPCSSAFLLDSSSRNNRLYYQMLWIIWPSQAERYYLLYVEDKEEQRQRHYVNTR